MSITLRIVHTELNGIHINESNTSFMRDAINLGVRSVQRLCPFARGTDLEQLIHPAKPGPAHFWCFYSTECYSPRSKRRATFTAHDRDR